MEIDSSSSSSSSRQDVDSTITQQLAALGAMDKEITDKPEITFFKKHFKRHSRFCIGNYEDDNIKNHRTAFGPSPGNGEKYYHYDFKSDTPGDLLSKVSLVWEFDRPYMVAQESETPHVDDTQFLHVNNEPEPNSFSLVHESSQRTKPKVKNAHMVFPIGAKSVFDLFSEVELFIGNSSITKLTSDAINFYMMSNKKFLPRTYDKRMYVPGQYSKETQFQMRVDLPFWFSQDYALSLPKSALKETIRLVIKARYKPTSIRYNYIHLDKTERELFVKAHCHKYLMNCMNHTNVGPEGRLPSLQHPTRYIFFRIKDMISDKVTLLLNGTPRMVCDKHQLNKDNYRDCNLSPTSEFGIMPFCIDASDSVNPSGSINFSRIEKVTIQGLTPGAPVYYNHWNIFNVISGAGRCSYITHYPPTIV